MSDYSLARAQKAVRNVAKAIEARDDAIRAAYAAGQTIRAIAEATGLSVSRVGQLTQGTR